MNLEADKAVILALTKQKRHYYNVYDKASGRIVSVGLNSRQNNHIRKALHPKQRGLIVKTFVFVHWITKELLAWVGKLTRRSTRH